MNIYNDDAIFLSEESTNTFVHSLTLNTENLSLRDRFVSDIEQNISFSEDGNSIVVDVPGIDFIDSENYMSVKPAVRTKEINIIVSTERVANTYDHNIGMQCYNRSESNSNSKYMLSKKTQSEQWYTGTKALNNVA